MSKENTFMSSISVLLIRNLQDVFGQNDAARRRVVIDEIYTEDCVFYDPTSGAQGDRDEIDRIAREIRAAHPDFRYQPIAEPEELDNGGGFNGYRGALVRRPLSPGLISSLGKGSSWYRAKTLVIAVVSRR
jgi:hypothetical protein